MCWAQPTAKTLRDPDVAALTGGGFAVAWTDAAGDASGQGIRVSVYDNAGNVVTSDLQVNTTTAGSQNDASVVGLADGGFLVAWEDDQASLTRAQRFDSAGHLVGSEFTVLDSVGGGAPSMTLLKDGHIAFAFDRLASGDWDVYTSIWDPQGAPDPTPTPDTKPDPTPTPDPTPDPTPPAPTTITGTSGKDTLTAAPQGSTLYGLGNNDTLIGLGGNDTLDGGSGNDTLKGGGGQDSLKGGQAPTSSTAKLARTVSCSSNSVEFDEARAAATRFRISAMRTAISST